MEVELPDGTRVQATPFGRPEQDPVPDWGLYLDHRWRPTWPHELIDWPDFSLPHDVAAADVSIVRAFEKAREGQRVEIGCLGGIGRTGTVLACMAVLAGIAPEEAVEWVRAHFRIGAVETEGQREFVEAFGRRR